MTTSYNVRSALNEGEMHAFKFNLKPDNISKTEPGLLTMQSVAEGGQAVAEFPSTGDDFYFYTGTTSQAKDVDCALVWDESSQTYVLHALSSFTRFTKVNKKPPKPVVRTQPIIPQVTTAVKPPSASRMQKAPSLQPQASTSVSPSSRTATTATAASQPEQQQSSPQARHSALARPGMPASSHSAPVMPRVSMPAPPPPPPAESSSEEEDDDDEEEESGDDDDDDNGSDSSEDFGDLASQMEQGFS